MIEAGAPSTEELSLNFRGCARPTGGSHGRTDEGPTQRFEGAKRRAAPGRGPRKRGQRQYKGSGPTGSGPASLAYLEFMVVLTATYRLYILVSRIR
jgi:hypothetical protein